LLESGKPPSPGAASAAPTSLAVESASTLVSDVSDAPSASDWSVASRKEEASTAPSTPFAASAWEVVSGKAGRQPVAARDESDA
jgi:hypothetical protein